MPFPSLHNENSILGKDSSVLMNVLEQMGSVQRERMSRAYLPLYFFCSDGLKKKPKNPVLTGFKNK